MKTIKREVRKEMRFYLAGPISWEKDNVFIEWREDISEFLRAHGHIPINPLKKYSVPAAEKNKVEKMIVEERDDVAREYLRRRIINPDLSLLEQSDAAIVYVDKYTVGTSSEVFWCYEHGRPAYIVTNLPRNKWSGWFVGLSTLIFGSWEELKRFLANMEVGI
jgi:nucleoside 2-deoxyribosyltransferase